MSDLKSMYESCMLCPRECGVNRLSGEKGFCGETSHAKVAAACLHRGEEPPITGDTGSGTVFFSGCTLQCFSCQNSQISRGHLGITVTESELAEIFLSLQKRGAATLNLVTGTQFIPSIANAMYMARKNGLSMPVVWNSSGFEKMETVSLLDDFVDIYLPDLKTLSVKLAEELFCCPEYPGFAAETIKAMAASRPLVWKNDMLNRGIILRHLAIPGHLAQTRECLAWYVENLGDRAILSIMTQYIPLSCENESRSCIQGKITGNEYGQIQEFLEELGIENGYFQELAEDDQWIPDFKLTNPFPGNYATPVWHYSCGFRV
ncbi:MAG: 4Fe-4S cluster-binding domain-containing protein [Spirochaetaceae bacterium]|nr:MAG: 4Fe-4S cluster-binding domain-containing protein [Spirochaetaceae bacterium]